MDSHERTGTVLLFLAAMLGAHGYPTGAPEFACMTMFPKHNGTQTQLEVGVYTVSTDTLTYTPNQRIKVRISSPVGKLFKGVMIRAHRTEVNQEEIIGVYENLVPANKLRYLNCHGRQNNMVTHVNNNTVQEVEVTWLSPADNVGPIIFDVTVVQSFFVLYYGLKSATIVPALSSPPVTYPGAMAPSVNNTVTPIDWDTCGSTKGCLLYPRYCMSDNCKAAASYKVNTDDQTATFELMVRGEEYVALGFSSDQTMGEDQTIACTSVFDRVTVQHGWNHPMKFNVQDRKMNLSKLEATSSEDGHIYCRFTRPVLMELTVAYDETQPSVLSTLTFDLNNEYFLFLAWGLTYETSDVIGFHYQMPVVSDTKVDFLDHSIYRGSVMCNLVRAHSTIMAVAWMGFASLAVIMARHYKDSFSEKMFCGVKIWFHFHRVSAIIAFVCTLVGLVLILVRLDGNITAKESAHTHMCLGLTVVALVFAQLLGGLIRPAPEAKFRPVFNFVHRFLGTSAIVTAAATLICAYKIRDFSYHMQSFGERTVAVWAGLLVLLEIAHIGYNHFTSAFSVNTTRTQEYNMDKDADQPPREERSSSNILLVISLVFVVCSITAAFIMTLFF